MGWANTKQWPAGAIAVNLTTYCPYQAGLTPEQRRIEGGATDPKGNALHTLEDHIRDPGAHPYVSLSGDKTLWAYGQRVLLPSLGSPSPEWQQQTGETDYVCRVVDTGGNFTGPNKVYRHPGYEPIDVCVAECYGPNESVSVLGLGVGRQQGTVVDEGAAKAVVNALGFPQVDPNSALVGLLVAGVSVAFLAWALLSGAWKGGA